MKFEKIILGIYLAVFAICAISPYSRSVWFAENLPIVIIVGLIIFLSRKHKFSKLSLVMMLVLPVLHTIGGHYTFERVPFSFITDLFGFERNHYDRLAHFSVGFFAYPISEYVMSKRYTRNVVFGCLFGIMVIFTTASVYEIIEWQYAVYADPEAGIAVLGSQGDVWDAQKDMLADGLGAILAACLFYYVFMRTKPKQVDAEVM